MSINKQNSLRMLLGAFIVLLVLFAGSYRASAATITRSGSSSSFSDIAVNAESRSVNVRSKPTTASSVVGKMPLYSAAVIKGTVDGEGGKWYSIVSGSVTGYIKAVYFKTGADALAVAKAHGTSVAKVTSNASLRLRSEPNTTSTILGKAASGTYVTLLDQDVKGSGFSKVSAQIGDTSKTGYMSEDYLKIYLQLNSASAVSKGNSGNASSSGSSSSSSSGSSSAKPAANSSLGSKIVAKAKSYVGKLNYVYGGTSLSSGADCSGFVKAIYNYYGVSVPRRSVDQAVGGKTISKSSLKPGDLVFYKNGGSTICHVGIYIGNNQIVHEANSKKGCIISNINYDTPAKYVTYLH
ncbi:MAG: NlpC/P60 family protein [Lachnospiraceae bacterium]